MIRFRRVLTTLTLASLLALAGRAAADPVVGQTLATVNATATALRSAPQWSAKAVAQLPQRTRVKVEEVGTGGWMRVSADVSGRPVSGWMRATQATAGPIPTAPTPVAAGPSGISAQDVSAAGRQFDAETERTYRAQHADVAAVYPLVDRMEVASVTIDPEEIEAFVREGMLAAGRPVRRDPLRDPGLVALANKPGKPKAADIGGRLLGGLGSRLGLGDRGKELAQAGLQGFLGYFDAMKKSFDPVQEYYLGRAVAANAIAKYGIDPDAGRRAYVQLIGQAMVRTTARLPATLGGYHFEVLNSDDVNGVSGPGGYVLVTRGAVLACRNEDELAGILLHELAHIQGKHAEAVIRQSGEMNAMVDGASGLLGAATGNDESRFKQALAGLFDKVVGKLVTNQIEHAYSRDVESLADLQGAYFQAELGFDYWSLRDMLRSMVGKAHRHPGATHATPEARAAYLDQQLAQHYRAYAMPQYKRIRETRFRDRLGLAAAAAPPSSPPR